MAHLAPISAAFCDSVFKEAVRFCNNSFKLPLCIYFHSKVIAAICIYLADQHRRQQKLDTYQLPKTIGDHPWYKWVDSGIEKEDMSKVLKHMKTLYSKPT